MKSPRIGGGLTIIGAVLFAIATLFHPPLTNPWDVSYAYKEMSTHEHWVLDHWVFLLGVTLWLIGLTHLSLIQSGIQPIYRLSAYLIMVALTLWVIILAGEIAVLPFLMKQITVYGQKAYLPAWNAFFIWGLFSGYLAMLFIYIALLFLSAGQRRWMKGFGLLSSGLSIIGNLLSLLFPEAALPLIVLNLLPFAWSLIFGWFQLRGKSL
ncbi:hypothetical protein GCM10011391_18710 [Pullulanibacillus camelliae]|uniref:DUF4386 family protein n=1 Tax=Pullulanibacillus camelliae TaxID=1707096 RepID=A0A8J2YH33_9BACL|nr:hypothetical protein [Pullulanibacillus camelliae]GGE40194.1 hypothetical protein GCM10011391_18710 [Pullulanibacillus camelliae]